MGAGQTHRIGSVAGIALALLACVGFLLQGVVRLTHHHDDHAELTSHAELQIEADEGDAHDEHEDAACTICIALAAASTAMPDGGAPAVWTPKKIGQWAEQRLSAALHLATVLSWRSRAPPHA